MNDDRRKRMTEFLGECWHEDQSSIYHPQCCSCGVEFGRDYHSVLDDHIADSNHTFTTAQDMVDLAKRLAWEARWSFFCNFSLDVYCRDNYRPDTQEDQFDFIYWLMVEDPARTCNLIGEFLEGEK